MTRLVKLTSFSSRSNKNCMNAVKLKVAAQKLHRRLSGLLSKKETSNNGVVIKGGHFAVIVFEQEEPTRIMLPLAILKHPVFLRLLEKAAEEYGFEHQGALIIPCSAMELERML